MQFTIKEYISGRFALDLACRLQLYGGEPAGTVRRQFPPDAWFGEHDPERDDLACLGTFGLHESSAWLRRLGFEIHRDMRVFVADPMRAVLDAIFFVSSMGLNPKPYFSEMHVQWGWQKREVLFHAVRIARFYNRRKLFEWLKFEFNNSQKFNMSEVLARDDYYG